MKKVFTIFTILILIFTVSCTERLTDEELDKGLHFFDVKPLFSPPPGLYFEQQTVTISCDVADATIRYTADGSEPTQSSNLYNGPIVITNEMTLKAIAISSEGNGSKIAIANYLIYDGTPMVKVTGGAFRMGRTTGLGEPDEHPAHHVTVSSFYIGKYLVTQKEYEDVVGENPSLSYGGSYGVGKNYPVHYVSWYSAIKFCNLLSIKEGLTPVYSIKDSTDPEVWGVVPKNQDSVWDAVICNWVANGYRLPTEAEWEYAARGGSEKPDYLYSGSDNLDEVGWYIRNNTEHRSKPVGGKMPNGLNVYDMSGNLREWCWDWYDATYYDGHTSTNPRGPESGEFRALRNGYWDDKDSECRIARRGSHKPAGGGLDCGFRLCRRAQ